MTLHIPVCYFFYTPSKRDKFNTNKKIYYKCEVQIRQSWSHGVFCINLWIYIYLSSYSQNFCINFFSSPDPKGQVSYCHHWASVRPLTFHILINSSEATGPIWTKLWWNGPWMAPFQNCVRWSRLPTKMAAKLKIEKGGMKFWLFIAAFV